MPYASRDVQGALVQKGFTEKEGSHKYYHFLHQGKDIGVSTKISHGMREIDDSLASKMKHQMKLRTRREFDDFVKCPMTYLDYLRVLAEQRFI